MVVLACLGVLLCGNTRSQPAFGRHGQVDEVLFRFTDNGDVDPPTVRANTDDSPGRGAAPPSWGTDMPPDILARVIDLLPFNDVATLLAVCRCWHRAIKFCGILSLQPLYLAASPRLEPFASVQRLSLPLFRGEKGLPPRAMSTSANGSGEPRDGQVVAPLRRGPRLYLERFQAVTDLVLSAQFLATAALAQLAALGGRLRRLDLSGCKLAGGPQALEPLLSEAPRLTHLAVEGLRLLPARPTVREEGAVGGAVRAFFRHGLPRLQQLASLSVTLAPPSSRTSGGAKARAPEEDGGGGGGETAAAAGQPGVVLAARCSDLAALTQLESLTIHGTSWPQELQSLGALLQLTALEWSPGAGTYLAASLAHQRFIGRLTRLCRLALRMPGRQAGLVHDFEGDPPQQQPGSAERDDGVTLSSLAGLTALTSLTWHSTNSLAQLLSIQKLTRLEYLDLCGVGLDLSTATAHAVTFVVAALSRLTYLDCGLLSTRETPPLGDVLVAGLRLAAPQLVVLKAAGNTLLGSGLRPAWHLEAAAAGVAASRSAARHGSSSSSVVGFHAATAGGIWCRLEELELCGSRMLRSRWCDAFSALTALQRLTIGGMSPAEFTRASRLKCYTALSELRQLTQLRVSVRRGEAPSPGSWQTLRPTLHLLP